MGSHSSWQFGNDDLHGRCSVASLLPPPLVEYHCCSHHHPLVASDSSFFSLPKWTEDPQLSRSLPSFRCHRWTAKASSFVARAALRLSALQCSSPELSLPGWCLKATAQPYRVSHSAQSPVVTCMNSAPPEPMFSLVLTFSHSTCFFFNFHGIVIASCLTLTFYFYMEKEYVTYFSINFVSFVLSFRGGSES